MSSDKSIQQIKQYKSTSCVYRVEQKLHVNFLFFSMNMYKKPKLM